MEASQLKDLESLRKRVFSQNDEASATNRALCRNILLRSRSYIKAINEGQS